MLDFINSLSKSASQTTQNLWETTLDAVYEHPYIVTGLTLAGAGLFFAARRQVAGSNFKASYGSQLMVSDDGGSPWTSPNKGLMPSPGGLTLPQKEPTGFPVSKRDKVIEAITKRDFTTAKQYIEQMNAEELNQGDANKLPILYYAVKNSGELTRLIVNIFLSKNMAINTSSRKGKSLFDNPTFGERLLGIVTEPYREYACMDAARYPQTIPQDANKDAILKRKPKDQAAYVGSNTIQPNKGKYKREAIANCAKLIDKAKAGVCTTLALAVADKLLKLFPNERIEIVAHKGGANGSHVFIVVNRQGEEWNFNNTDEFSQKEAVAIMLEKIAKEWKKAFIVDPWLASLGWEKGVFDILNYMKRCGGDFLTNLECFYDSNSTTLQPAPKNAASL